MLINGELVEADKSLPVINPATGESFDNVPDASKADVDRAVAAAKEAFKTWKKTPWADRCACLEKFAEGLTAIKDDLAKALCMEQGKPIMFAKGEANMACNIHKGAIKAGELVPEKFEANEKGEAWEHFVPRGVIGAITPWNFPLMLALKKIVPATITGNTIVIKASPYTPLTTLMCASAAKAAFPAGVVNIVSGGNEPGQWIVEHPDVKQISFTGSSATGKKIMATCAGTLKKVCLELGGNDPVIVLPDSDVDKIAPAVLQKAMFNTGQVCIAAKRVFVHEDQYEKFVEKLVDATNSMKVGDGMQTGTTHGPLNNKMQLERVEELVEDARKGGARIVTGGARKAVEGKPNGYYYEPTIVADVTDETRLVAEEQFGPALPVLKYSTVDEAVDRANDTDMGLGASVWGDQAEAEKVAIQLEAGNIWTNTHLGSGLDIDAPFGGLKGSGIGKEDGGKTGLKQLCDVKVMYVPAK